MTSISFFLSTVLFNVLLTLAIWALLNGRAVRMMLNKRDSAWRKIISDRYLARDDVIEAWNNRHPSWDALQFIDATYFLQTHPVDSTITDFIQEQGTPAPQPVDDDAAPDTTFALDPGVDDLANMRNTDERAEHIKALAKQLSDWNPEWSKEKCLEMAKRRFPAIEDRWDGTTKP